jgi:hypothetical protein
VETDPKDEDAGPEEVEVEPYPEEPYPPDEVVVEPYWPPALSEPKAAAVAASISGLSSFMILSTRLTVCPVDSQTVS